MIADDDAFFRIALGALLTSQLGFTEVLDAGSLDDALELLGNHPDIGLALFDLSMPGIKEAGNLSAVRECSGHVTLVVVSGSTARHDILSALGAGVHGYIPKALGPADLVKALQLVLGGQIYVPACLAEAPVQPVSSADAHPEDDHDALSSLTKRQYEVLRAIVEDYVATEEPVGSRALVERHQLGVSPATVRNDMAVLEEEGFITQPHTSAGRIPTDKGYRLFVDRLT
ncbi:MAG: response regulator, partial [Proteobacteria bacterium]|nr:response regulator [Pseudomonadota bacterium]